jgi:D-glycerate 3-kinase
MDQTHVASATVLPPNPMPSPSLVAEKLCQHLGFTPGHLTRTEHHRVHEYYLPVAMWILNKLAERRSSSTPSCIPLTVGLSAPQGCGKTTLVESLVAVLSALDIGVASASIDDFYLTRADQIARAAQHPGNPLLELRGNAGSHDLHLGTTTLRALQSLGAAAPPGLMGTDEVAAVENLQKSTVYVPRYDKSLHGGKGDRAPEEEWAPAPHQLEVILFEGWMLGFEPVGRESAAAVSPHLVDVDQYLTEYVDQWHAAMDAWIVVQVGNPEWCYKWRLQAEVAMRNRGKVQ